MEFGIDLDDSPEISMGEDEAEEIVLDADEPATDLSFGLDGDAALEFGLTSPQGPAAEAQPAEAPASVTATDRGEEDLAFITEHMTEAEVFAKYGLLDRAIEHLNKVLDHAPEHLPAYEKLFHTYLEESQNENAGELGRRFVRVLREQNENERAEEIVNELASRGLDSGESTPPGAPEVELAGEVSDEPEEMTLPDEMELEETSAPTVDSDEPEEISLEIEPEELELEAEDLPEVEEELELEAGDELTLEVEEEPASVDASGLEMEVSSEELTLDFDEGAGLDLAPEEPEEIEEIEEIGEDEDLEEVEELAETAVEEIEEPEELEMSFGETEVPSAAEAHPSATAGQEPLSEEELSEIDFYIEQELFDEASERLEAMAAAHPDDSRVRNRIETIQQKRSAVPPPAEPDSPPALDIEAELLSAIPDDDDEVTSGIDRAQASAEEEPPLAAEISAEEEEGLFADEDDFFDLAAELEQELEGEFDDDISLSEEEQSLEDVFREFKKGVEEQLDAEDHDTHYNLGIAYKEMGLIDEAIGEFQIASKDPKRTVECCSMLGLCFLEKGMPQLAIKWYNKGLEVPEITEDEHIGLLYELASAHVEVGDTTQAHKTFVEIYGVNSNYRDVAERIKQLENVSQ